MEDKVLIKNDQGEEKEYDIVFTFVSENTHQKYVTYTDYSKDENGDIICLSSMIGANDELLPVTTEAELQIIDEMLKTLSNS